MPSSIGSSSQARRPSWRRLLVATAVVFLVVLAFLAGRLRAGLDPAQATQGATRAHATVVHASSSSAASATAAAPAATTPDPSPPTTHAS